MSGRRRFSSGARWESLVGYSRAVRVGNTIHVAGTTATAEDGSIVGVGDAYAQTVRILEIVREALHGLDARMEHVVRTRIFVTDVTEWEAVGRAHAETFGDIRPATTLVEVSRLVSPEMLVEIEVEAIVEPV